ncbi:hypothetical protein C0995_012486 [Termitomyces sp. Mi166|nr:hypothetical protein C0995_012486 [Termitomyces sp. Mi166\
MHLGDRAHYQHLTSKPIVLVPSMSKFVPKPIVTLASPVAGPSTARQFKLEGMEESGVLIINQATEVPATQGTLHSEESGDEDAEGDNDNSDGSDVAMNVDSAKQPEETWPVALIKTVTEVKAPALALVPALRPSNLNKTGLVWNDGKIEHVAIMKWRTKCWKT